MIPIIADDDELSFRECIIGKSEDVLVVSEEENDPVDDDDVLALLRMYSLLRL